VIDLFQVPQVDREDEIEKERERLRAEFEREVSEIRRQCDAERMTKEELQRKYDELKGQYDSELNALETNQNEEENQPPPVVNERGKTKKKGGILKNKRDGEGIPNSQDTDDGDNTSLPADQMDQRQKLERLQELENKLVGGEDLNNEERKKKRKKKLNDMREKQEKRKRFNHAMNGDDDDAMMRVFDNIQDEVRLSKHFPK
jgi:hypothetical protein